MSEQEIEAGKREIESALGERLCSDANPTGFTVSYEPGYSLPWLLVDEQGGESFATVADAVAFAQSLS